MQVVPLLMQLLVAAVHKCCPVLLQVATLPFTPAGPPHPPQPASPDSATSISTAIHAGDWHHTSYSRPAPEMTQQTQGMLDKVMHSWGLACRSLGPCLHGVEVLWNA